ncbi:uncharacterized protein LOC131875764 [Cryptomeria japonica]|uniref:uncharacterized protein LOC131875764 n=1 Tax=Cryptomeria japonica TaxID=3369 RepID=UPI0027DA338C|nr:uncharacterized protein LOC131875764 [Cryptomeria japonica]
MTVFGNLFEEKQKIEGELGALNLKVLLEGMDEVDYLTEKDLLTRYGEVRLKEEFLAVIPQLISRKDNRMLEEPSSLKELKAESGFTPERNIVDGIIVAHEAIHTAMKSRQRRMMLKLDIQKSYDRVDRSFLLVVLAKFGFKVGSQRSIAKLFGIRIGQLLGKFLGMLLFSGVGKTKIWKGLLDGCKAKMEGWKSKWLMLAGRILMLKSVISTMSIFSMACFKLPGIIIKNIQQKMKKFLWNGKQNQDKIPLMAWDRVYKPKGGGGVGLRDWKLINEAIVAKLLWQMYSKPEQRWVRILQAKYLDNGDRERIFTIENPTRGFALWNFLLNCRSLVTNHLTWRIGDGHKASF